MKIDKPFATAEDFIGKHSSEYPKQANCHNIVLIGTQELQANDPSPSGVCILQVANTTRGGADAVIVVSKDGVWIRGLEEKINYLVAKALAESAVTK